MANTLDDDIDKTILDFINIQKNNEAAIHELHGLLKRAIISESDSLVKEMKESIKKHNLQLNLKEEIMKENNDCILDDLEEKPIKSVKSDATYLELNGIRYNVGDKVKSGLDLNTDEENIFEEGIVAFGEFYAEVYKCYGFFVADPETGNQVSAGGLTEEHQKLKL